MLTNIKSSKAKTVFPKPITWDWAITIVVAGIAALVLWLRYQNKIEERLNIVQGGA